MVNKFNVDCSPPPPNKTVLSFPESKTVFLFCFLLLMSVRLAKYKQADPSLIKIGTTFYNSKYEGTRHETSLILTLPIWTSFARAKPLRTWTKRRGPGRLLQDILVCELSLKSNIGRGAAYKRPPKTTTLRPLQWSLAC